MQHIELVVHQRIDRFQYHVEGQIVPCRIYHDPSIGKIGLIGNLDRQMGKVAAAPRQQVPKPLTLEHLQQGFHRPHHPNICLGRDLRMVLFGFEGIRLLLFGEHAA